MALGIDGLRIGMWTSPTRASGCTVLLPPDGTVGTIAVRGSAPGTREAAALSPAGRVDVCHGVVLAGGSAYGLAAADGVMRYLEAHRVGYPVLDNVVPIVGAAIVLDLAVVEAASRPDAPAGWEACELATAEDPEEGSVGAGAGVTVAKVGGLGHCWRSGQGVAVRRSGELVVSALVVNNAVGEVVDDDGSLLAATRAAADSPRFPEDPDALLIGLEELGVLANTVIGCVVTNAALGKSDLHRVTDLAHGGIVRAVRPAHTSLDGDALFGLATGAVEATVDLVAALAVEAVAEAARRGPLAASAGHGLPAVRDPLASD